LTPEAAEERAKAIEHIRRNAEINLSSARKYGQGKDRHALLAEYVATGDRGALECYRMFYIAEAFKAVADAIEDGTHLSY
jgi:hypothetical protein